MIDASFTYLSEFVPHVIAAVEFAASRQATSVVEAVAVLREPYARGRRKVPDDAPTGFVPTRWRGYLEEFDLGVSSIPRATFYYLASLEWIRGAENLALVGPAGTGKSHCESHGGHPR